VHYEQSAASNCKVQQTQIQQRESLNNKDGHK